MSVASKVGAFNTTTNAATNTVVVNDVGFQPKAIIFWWSGRTETTDTLGRATMQRGCGFAVSATDRRCFGSLSQDTAAAAVTNNIYRDDACIASTTTGDAVDGLMDVQSMDSGGFTLVVDDAFSASLRVHYLALGGSDITNVATVQWQKPASTTPQTQDITTVGFQPDTLIFMGSSAGSGTPPLIAVDSRHMVGFATSTSARGVGTWSSDDAQATMRTARYINASECLAGINTTANGIGDGADFTAFLSNGFRVNWALTTATNRWFFALCLQGVSCSIGSFSTQTDTTTAITVSGLSFRPTGVLLLTAGTTQSTLDTSVAHDVWGMGAFTGPGERGAQATSDQSAVADAVVATAVEHDECLITLNTDGSLNGLLDCQTMNPDGFTLIMDDADSSANFVLYAAFGPATRPTTRTLLTGVGM